MNSKPKSAGITVFCLVAAFAINACGTGTDTNEKPSAGAGLSFENVDVGFSHASGMAGEYAVPEIIGSGGALIDYDDDGDLDVLLVNSDDTNDSNLRLFRNDDMAFTDVTSAAGFSDTGYGMGAAIGDIDNDGDRDIYVTHFQTDRLYQNNGNGTFSDISAAAGIAGSRWSSSALFFDYDQDGRLDLFVAGYLSFDPDQRCLDKSGRREYCGPKSFAGVTNVLYRNLGDGQFENMSVASGIASTAGKSLGVVAHDFTNDGLPDIYVANDGEKNELWINQGNGSFVDRAVVLGVAYNLFGKPEASMGLQIGDVNQDGWQDLFVTHLSDETNTLYLGSATENLQDATVTSGFGPDSMPYTGFGTALTDMDHDGDLDLLVVNGRVTRDPSAGSHETSYQDLYGEPNQYFENDGGVFRLACDETPEFCEPRFVDRALLAGDIDLDGDIDILVTNSNGPLRFYRNNMPKKGNWLRIRALLADHNRDAIGATIRISSTDQVWLREISHAGSYLSGVEAWTHFGIGKARQIDNIVIAWPDGSHEAFGPVASNQSITLRYGSGRNPDQVIGDNPQ